MLSNKRNNINNKSLKLENKKSKVECEEIKKEDKIVEVENVKEECKIDKQVKSKKEDKSEVKKKRIIEEESKEDEEEDKMIELNCGHEVNKDRLIHYALNLFIKKMSYEYCCWCETCKKVEKLKSLPLSCGCSWTMFGKKIKASYGRCDKGHLLTSIDLGLLNNFTSLMISDYPKEKKNL